MTLAGTSVALAAATVILQVAYPLAGPAVRPGLTIGTVLTFAAASLTHAVASRGPAAGLALALAAAGGGLVVEAVGVRTGLPFGHYSYAGTLGPQVLGVPLVIPLAWLMMAYPALVAARRLCGGAGAGARGLAVPLVGGWALATWDLFLDPQMVAAGHWSWRDPTPALPGVPGIPATNFAGWLVVAVVMVAALHATVPDRPGASDGVPAALYLWTYASSVVANAWFFGRPTVALVGGLAMGAVAVPYAVSLRRGRT